MWLTFIAIVLVIAALLASIASGGVFTIILIPLAAVAVVVAVAFGLLGRVSAMSAGETKGDAADGRSRTSPNTLPRSQGSSGHVLSSPEQLADARREQQ